MQQSSKSCNRCIRHLSSTKKFRLTVRHSPIIVKRSFHHHRVWSYSEDSITGLSLAIRKPVVPSDDSHSLRCSNHITNIETTIGDSVSHRLTSNACCIPCMNMMAVSRSVAVPKIRALYRIAWRAAAVMASCREQRQRRSDGSVRCFGCQTFRSTIHAPRSHDSTMNWIKPVPQRGGVDCIYPKSCVAGVSISAPACLQNTQN